MADQTTTTTRDSLSRRQALLAGSAAGAGALIPTAAAAAEDPDRAAWLELWENFLEHDARHSEATDREDAASTAARNEYLPRGSGEAEEAWEARCRAIDQRHDVPALEEALEAEEAVWSELCREFNHRPAAGITGIAIKLAFEARIGMLDDAPAAGSAMRDALRLAGLPEDLADQRAES